MNIRWWAFWRRVQYIFLLVFLLGAAGAFVYVQYGYTEPTCFDGLLNGDEHDVDCGGSCERICAVEIIPPRVVWAESFRITDGQYNAVAYVENRNTGIGTPKLTYTMTLKDAEGVITERTGSTVFPPGSVYPLFEGKILTGDRVPTQTIVTFAPTVVWQKGSLSREQFELKRRDLLQVDTTPRLTAELYNKTLEEARDVEIVATIFDAGKRPLTASRTVVPLFAGRSTETVVFTWPHPISKTVRSCEVPTDIVLGIDMSGSMNNDSDTPPEPVSSVLAAGDTFIRQLRNNDQVGVVTYATDALLVAPLTREIGKVADIVQGLVIDPQEETGSTNTGEALMRINEELMSSRHNADARKVAIILTDGLATAPGDDPDTYARDAAQKLRDNDVVVYTIGLGEAVNEVFLRDLAGDDGRYFFAPSTGDLDIIYKKISTSICEDGPAVIEIIPKVQSSFTPLE